MPSTSSVDVVVDFVCKAATELESSSKVCHCLTFEMSGSFFRRCSSSSMYSQEETRIGWLENEPGCHCERIFKSSN